MLILRRMHIHGVPMVWGLARDCRVNHATWIHELNSGMVSFSSDCAVTHMTAPWLGQLVRPVSQWHHTVTQPTASICDDQESAEP